MRQQLHDWWQQWLISADEAATRLRGTFGHRECGASGRPVQINALEPRILFSATPIDPSMMPGGEEVAMVMEVDAASSEASTIETLAESTTQQQSLRELVFIDGRVPDIEQLLEDLNTSGREAEVFVLDTDRDGVDQITEILESRSGIESIHIVSHAEDGAVRLGNVWLGDSNLSGYAGQIASWQSSLTSSGDILFYGCDLASDSQGRDLIDSISVLTGADVAASDDGTGHASFEADWDLEFSTGNIEAGVAFSEDLQSSWIGKLATITVDTDDDVLNGSDGLTSLREAIIAAAAGDTIIVGSGDYDLTIDTLDVNKNLTILGADARTTIIDASALSQRAFHLTGTTVLNLSGVTIQGGDENNGGGIFVDNSSTLNLSDATLTDNTSDKGGAIHVHGTANLNRVLLHDNSVTNPGPGRGEGGAIHFHDADGGTLTNVTISGNTSEDEGGGLWTNTVISITNSTITLNDSSGFGGGIYSDGVTVNISNTIVAANDSIGSSNDVYGGFNSDGSNLIEVASGATGFGGDITGVSADLGDLRNNGGQTDTHALALTSAAVDAGTTSGAPTIDQRGISRDASPDIGAFELRSPEFWLSTVDNVTGSGVSGLNSWQNGEVIELAGSTFSSAFNLEAVAGTNLDVDGIHYVTRDITLGTTDTIDLQAGDVLFTTNGDETIDSLAVAKYDVMLFRPDTPGDYSAGSFSYVLTGLSATVDLKSFTLVEQDTTFGDTTLAEGDFLFTQEGGAGNDIYVFHIDDVGNGTTAGTTELLISGSDIGITENIDGLELLETNTTVGAETLAAGELLVSVEVLDDDIGTSEITADSRDIFRLQVVKTTAVTGTSVADAAMLLDGSSLGLDTPGEDLDALTLLSAGDPGVIPSSTLTVTTASDVDDGDTSSVAALLGDMGADGMISLREAITAANATDGLNTIHFDIAGSGPHVISLDPILGALPFITGTVIIDGTSEPDFGDAPMIQIDGTALSAAARRQLRRLFTG